MRTQDRNPRGLRASIATLAIGALASGLLASAPAASADGPGTPPPAPTGVTARGLGYSADAGSYFTARIDWAPVDVGNGSPLVSYTLHDHDNTNGEDDWNSRTVPASDAPTAIVTSGTQGDDDDLWMTATNADGQESAASATVKIVWPTFYDAIPAVQTLTVGQETAGFRVWPRNKYGQASEPTAIGYRITLRDESAQWADYLAVAPSIPNLSDRLTTVHNATVLRDAQDILARGPVAQTVEQTGAGDFALDIPYTGGAYGIEIAGVYADGQVSPNSTIQPVSPLPAMRSADPASCAADPGCMPVGFADFPGDTGTPPPAGYIVTATDTTHTASAQARTMSAMGAAASISVYGTSSPVRVPGLIPGHTYSFSVTAVDAAGLPTASQSLADGQTPPASTPPASGPAPVYTPPAASPAPTPTPTPAPTSTAPATPAPTPTSTAPTAKPAPAPLPQLKPAADAPRIAGPAGAETTVSATIGALPAGTRLSYQWKLGGRPIAKATAARYTIPALYAGNTLTVAVTAAHAGYRPYAATSPAVKIAAGRLANTHAAYLAGSTLRGQRLYARAGAFARYGTPAGVAGVAVSYQWYLDGRAIAHATASTFTTPASYRGRLVSVRIAGSKAGFASWASVSAKARIR